MSINNRLLLSLCRLITVYFFLCSVLEMQKMNYLISWYKIFYGVFPRRKETATNVQARCRVILDFPISAR